MKDKNTQIKNKSDDEKSQEPLMYHRWKLDDLVSSLKTSKTDGLDEHYAAQILAQNGKNKIKSMRRNQLFKIVGYFFGGFGTLFLLAAVACIICWKPLGSIQGNSDPTNLAIGILLFLVVVVQASFSSFQDWSSNKAMKSIENMMPSMAYVIRNGKERCIPVEELVVGDLVRLVYGDKVPADCRIIESSDLKFDRSMLTGESDAIDGVVECTDEKYVESKNIAFMTTLITNGDGKALVVATGVDTMFGQISYFTNQTIQRKNSLQLEINRFVKIIVCAATIAGCVVIIVWVAWLRTKYPRYINFISIIIDTISVVIGFLPDGLPISVTLSLLLIAISMKKRQVLVKNLTIIETLSRVNVIASDKTGTLTKNKMFVTSFSIGIHEYDLNKKAYNDNFIRSIGFNQLVTACSLCNSALFEDDGMSIRNRKATGNATDIAILKFATEYEKFPNLQEIYEISAQIPFNSRLKWMAKLVRPKDMPNHRIIFGFDENYAQNDVIILKGAPDVLIKKSTQIIDQHGNIIPISAALLKTLKTLINNWSLTGQRVLMICKKVSLLSAHTTYAFKNYIQSSNDFCILGLVGMVDPPRDGIADVLAKCKSAGIRVMMITGDHPLTAAAVALKIGILTQPQYDTAEILKNKYKENHSSSENSSLLLTGDDLENINTDEWRLVTKYKEIVFARTSPKQKLLVVNEFQKDGNIVGVTGNGVNDAPALKSADIGIAMGGGSEVAMEAAQLVLMDNNFSSILVAIENGRLVFDNLRKVIMFLLPGGSLSELIPVFMTIFLGVPLNLSSFSMIIISVCTDVPPSLSLIKEPPEVDLLSQPPKTKKDHLVDWKFFIQAYAFIGLMETIFSQFMYFVYMKLYMNMTPSQIFLAFDKIYHNFNESNYEMLQSKYTNLTMIDVQKHFDEQYFYAQTVTFVSIVVLQTFGNLFSVRTRFKSFFQSPPWKSTNGNRYIFLAQLASILCMIIAVYVPFFNRIFDTRPIPGYFIAMPLVFCIFIFALDELRKLAVRRKLLCFPNLSW